MKKWLIPVGVIAGFFALYWTSKAAGEAVGRHAVEKLNDAINDISVTVKVDRKDKHGL